ncbi:calcium binding protein 2 [Artemisia annua]|uniref:Calcineurin B-like protein n=1 Tax=Artemisia annua TaxID=35608 RepID=A0A2U1P1R0_ARTAN|nr:calcium binding protein 2 [Artemisia annua]
MNQPDYLHTKIVASTTFKHENHIDLRNKSFEVITSFNVQYPLCISKESKTKRKRQKGIIYIFDITKREQLKDPKHVFRDLTAKYATRDESANRIYALQQSIRCTSKKVFFMKHGKKKPLDQLVTFMDGNFFKKISNTVAFGLFDLRRIGYIEREIVREMIVATLKETGLRLSEEILEDIIDNTFAGKDAEMDGRINKEEWRNIVIQRPQLLKNMTLPSLRYIRSISLRLLSIYVSS